jgi:acetylornithine deacetylase/succinyl-diaminopimelate desuccinylase-like protein
VLYARGVAQGKGPLVAHLQAVRALLHAEDELPCGLVVVVEGEGLQGSAHLAEVVAHYAHELRADACLSTAGERDQEGSPFCYGGSKGLLRVQLDAHGSAYPLPAGMATSVSNPVWRLTWALNQIKGEDEDIRINGFYDRIGGPSKGEREILRAVALDEAGRCEAWQIPAFLFNMSGVALVRSEVTLPTCNISSFVVEPATSVQCVPVAASAQLDFQLVPDQQPDDILALLRKHLLERSFEDIDIVPLPGSYSPVREAVDQPFVQCLANIGTYVYGTAFAKMPLGSFAQPLHVFASQFGIPVAALALARQTSAIHGANEHILLDDLVRHGQVLAALMNDYAENFGQIAIPR